ncbi:MAG: hypothetical protein KDC58_08145 [Cyclobacteriaceae bacterium]|nr:hypothetical protein [Cyclobacteriaceae bacterium]
MKKLLQISLLFTVAIVVSCSKDEPEPINPVVGEWLQGSFSFTNLPADFSDWEGYEDVGFWGEDSYQLILNKDFTYSREITVGSNVFNEEGDWETDDDNLFLDPDGQGLNIFEDFKVVEATSKDLTLSTDITILLIPNIYYDTVTQAYKDMLDIWETEDPDRYEEELNKIFQPTSATLVYEFDKTND